VIAFAACGRGGGGGSSSTKSSTASSQPASGGTSSDAVKIDNFKFMPATVTVAHGARVTVTNADSTAHTATADNGSSFDTGNIDPGSSKTITVPKAGRYAYHCTIHPFMHGTLVVK
jgi:plastocyanin